MARIVDGAFLDLRAAGISVHDVGAVHMGIEELAVYLKTRNRPKPQAPVENLRQQIEDELLEAQSRHGHPRRHLETTKQKIIIVDIDYDFDTKKEKITKEMSNGLMELDYDVNSSGGQKSLVIQTIPSKLEYEVNSNFATIASIARNNPFYHYTGSEDVITFDIDWFAEQEDLTDVLSNCRWLESLTKANGYDFQPHRVSLSWGDIFRPEDIWLITKASYIMGGFDNTQSLLPHIAKQQVEMKRITKTNLTYIDIRSTTRNSDYRKGVDLLKRAANG